MLHHKSNQQSGFTLVEVMIIAPIIILIIGIFVSVMVSMTGDVMTSRAANALAFDVQDALNRIKQDVRYSAGFLSTTNSLAITLPQGYNDDTTGFDNANADPSVGQMLILKTNATSGNPITSSQNLVYLVNQPNACNSVYVTKNTAMFMNIVYFVKTVNGVSSLWRRMLVPSDYATTGCINGSIQAPWQRPSCTPGNGNIFCKADDIKLLDGVLTANFSIIYGDKTSSATTLATASDYAQSDANRQTSMNSAGSVLVSITATQTVAGRSISQSGTARAIYGK